MSIPGRLRPVNRGDKNPPSFERLFPYAQIGSESKQPSNDTNRSFLVKSRIKYMCLQISLMVVGLGLDGDGVWWRQTFAARLRLGFWAVKEETLFMALHRRRVLRATCDV